MSRRILISGASIAGNATALTLARAGFDVTVIEQAPAFRDGGQNVDIRDVGRDVLRLLGLEQAALDQGTGEEGTAWINEDGETVAEIMTDDVEGDGPTAELEILRGDLARLLFDAAQDRVSFRFGDTIARLVEDDSGVEVHFDSGARERFECVMVAEGVGSRTRDQVFPGENDPRWLDLTLAYFTIPRTADDDRRWRWYHATEGRSIHLRPDRHGTTRAMLSVQKASDGEQDWDVARQKQYLHERFADAGWQAPRVLAGMDAADDFYFDVLRQVRMKRWHTQRVVLTGDAAWCVTPMGGIGATLAVTGAYVLAGELALHPSPGDAFAAYEAAMRPMVDQGQGVPKIVPRLMNPQSETAVRILHGVLGLATSAPVRSATAKLSDRDLKGPDLSRYAARLETRVDR
ncbi:FAD-dependent monooxygenase [Luteimonas fraxinea]|uniref:FAD-dependent monooxygenase n=1 Tax=Luteimonas fraxinea TaxID=2901869 RepID=A0ABS8UD21_9GAMM|nr:FAD-dependent monooxygenase [Luteimonas fraxinea]MCD9096785.1 FAD-dependent monooxygenase [Luteimonas fraxinea]